MAVYGFNGTKDKIDIVDKENIQLEQALTFEAWDSLTHVIASVCETLKRLNAKAYDEDIDAMIKAIINEQAKMADCWTVAKEKMTNW